MASRLPHLDPPSWLPLALGQVTFLGLSAALNVLLGFSGRGEECSRPPDPTALYRVEVAAMVTTCAKLSAACDLIERLDALDAAAGEE